MRIAQVAPLYERIPPVRYGGTERIVHCLTEQLVRRGHEVTLFATADSDTCAKLCPMAEEGTRLGGARDPLALHIAMLEEVYSRANEFDLIHSHVDVLAFPFARWSPTPTITTMHGRLDFPEHRRVLSRFPALPLVSISQSQRDPLRECQLNWVGNVYNGVHLDNFRFTSLPEDPPYLVFLGRISPEKGPQDAVEIARRSGIRLIVAAKIDSADEDWASQHFLPLLESEGVKFLGEIDETEKAELLHGATAMLFPINWPEPFGIAMVEALASGVPVIAFRGGSVEEVLVHGETGFVCKNVDEAVDLVRLVDQLDRRACRRCVEERFCCATMADGYEQAYERAISNRTGSSAPLVTPGSMITTREGSFGTLDLLADPSLPANGTAGSQQR